MNTHELNDSPHTDDGGALLDRKAIAKRWQCSIESVKRRTIDGTLSPVYLPGGRLVRYRLADIIKAEGGTR